MHLTDKENLDTVFITESKLRATGDESTMRQITPDGYKLPSFLRERDGKGGWISPIPLNPKSMCALPSPGSVLF